MADVTLAGPTAARMAELLHELGQPLTTLQGCRLLPLLAEDDRNALASEMAGQVDRVTELYRELRCLLAAAIPEAGPSGPEPVAESPATARVPRRMAKALLEAESGRVVYNLHPFRATIQLPGTEALPSR